MKVVIWIGKEANQLALAAKIASEFNVVGIALETKSLRKISSKKNMGFYWNKLIEKIALRFISKTWFHLLKYYQTRFNNLPRLPILEVPTINSQEVLVFTKNLNPDLIVVSGTYLVKHPLIDIQPTMGIINLHTGLSPYIKGGPNCTNWCIATDQFHYIGNTIMWLNEGIDSGNLILTECTPLTGEESFFDLHVKVMEHAHETCLKALHLVKNGDALSIPQNNIAKGYTYYTKNWNLKAQFALKRNWKQFKNKVKSKEFKQLRSQIKIVGNIH